MTTYEIINKLKEITLMRDAVNEETGEYIYTEQEIAKLEDEISATKEQKLNAIQDYRLSLDDEIARFTDKKKKQEANIKNTKRHQDYLKELQADLLGGEKLKTDEYNFYYTTTTSVYIIKVDDIQDKFCTFTKVADKKLIKEALLKAEENEESFIGANLVKKKNLVVR